MARQVTLTGTAQKAAIYGSTHAESYIRTELQNNGIGVVRVTVTPQSWLNNWVTVSVTVQSPEWQSRTEIENVVTQAFRNIASTAGGVPIISSPSRFTVTSDTGGAHANLAHIVGKPVNWDALNPGGGDYVHQGGNLATVTVRGGWGGDEPVRTGLKKNPSQPGSLTATLDEFFDKNGTWVMAGALLLVVLIRR
jgi:hypothetical protein